MIGVNGWCSANQASPVGIESVGTKALDRNGSRISGIGALLAASTLPLASPSATHSQVTAQAHQHDHAGGADPPGHRGAAAVAERERDGEDDEHAEDRLRHRGQHVPGQRRRPGDRHRPEPVDDPLGRVLRDQDRGAVAPPTPPSSPGSPA